MQTTGLEYVWLKALGSNHSAAKKKRQLTYYVIPFLWAT
jgi:hypothetical protein